MARNPPTCPTEKRSLGENLVTDKRMTCSAHVRLRTKAGRGLNFLCYKHFRLGLAGEPNICSHCYDDLYMKMPANNQATLLARPGQVVNMRLVNAASHGLQIEWDGPPGLRDFKGYHYVVNITDEWGDYNRVRLGRNGCTAIQSTFDLSRSNKTWYFTRNDNGNGRNQV